MIATAACQSNGSGPLPAEVATWVAAGAGERVRAVPLGSISGTWLLNVGGQRRIVKRFPRGWTADQLAHLFDVLRMSGIPCAPLLGRVEVESVGYALFDFVPGHVPQPGTAHWREMHDAVFVLLGKLLRVPLGAAPRDIETAWIERVAATAAADADGNVGELHARVAAWSGRSRFRGVDVADRSDAHHRTALAHGDLAPQNLLRTGTGFVLLDWEETGFARFGFDAGWLLALNRIGAGLRMERRLLLRRLTGLGFRPDELDHFEGLGLLRLHHRTAGWAAGNAHFAPLLTWIRTAIGAHLEWLAQQDLPRRASSALSHEVARSTHAGARRNA